MALEPHATGEGAGERALVARQDNHGLPARAMKQIPQDGAIEVIVPPRRSHGELDELGRRARDGRPVSRRFEVDGNLEAVATVIAQHQMEQLGLPAGRHGCLDDESFRRNAQRVDNSSKGSPVIVGDRRQQPSMHVEEEQRLARGEQPVEEVHGPAQAVQRDQPFVVRGCRKQTPWRQVRLPVAEHSQKRFLTANFAGMCVDDRLEHRRKAATIPVPDDAAIGVTMEGSSGLVALGKACYESSCGRPQRLCIR